MSFQNKKALIFLILFIVSFFVSLFLNFNRINVPYFGALYKEVQLDVVFKNNPPQVYFDGEEIKKYFKIDENHYLFKNNNFSKVENITLKNYKNIEQIGVYIGNEASFSKEVENKIEINNDKTLFDKTAISLLSFIYNPWLYIVSYVFLFLFLYNTKINYKEKYCVIGLLFISFFLRMAQINNIPFWDDEIYVLAATADHSSLKELFNDPGNPPLYFIFFKIYRLIVQNQDFYRFSSVIFGVLFNYCFYNYLKNRLGTKKALIGLLIVCVNIILIYFSQEIRCYMLLMLLAVINSYCLFKFKNKTKFQYLFSTIALLFTHYYGAFFVFYNFAVGLILFFKKKNRFKSFLVVNLLAFLSFLPWLVYKSQNLTNNFNSWMKVPDWEYYRVLIEAFFGNLLIFLIFLILCAVLYLKISKKREKIFFNYHFCAIVFVFICAILFSYLIKPIFYYKYFYVVFPSYLALVILFVGFNYKTKYKIILAFLLFLLLGVNSKVSYQNLFCNHNLYLDYVRFDIDKTKQNYVFMTDTVEKYKNFKIKDAINNYLLVNQGMQQLDFDEYEFKKDAIIYVSNLYLDEKIMKIAKKIMLFKTPLGVFCKIKL